MVMVVMAVVVVVMRGGHFDGIHQTVVNQHTRAQLTTELTLFLLHTTHAIVITKPTQHTQNQTSNSNS